MMRKLRVLLLRLRALLFGKRLDRDLDEEMQFHIDMQADAYRRQGLSEPEARRAATQDFGHIVRLKEEARDTRGVRLVYETLQDARYAARMSRTNPGFTAVILLTLALGIGANTAIFSVIHGVLLRPLPYQEPDRLALLWHQTAQSAGQRMRIPAPDVADYRAQTMLFEDFAFTANIADVALTTSDRDEHARLGVVSDNFFSVLGAAAALGRTFNAGEAAIPSPRSSDREFSPPLSLLVLSHGFWQRRFGGDRAVIGQFVEIDVATHAVVLPRRYEVVGVMPPSFRMYFPPGTGLASDVDAWAALPTGLDELQRPDGRLLDQDSDNTGAVIGRLRNGVTFEQAQSEMDAIAARQRAQFEAYDQAAVRIDVQPMHQDLVAHARPALLALFGAVGFVLLIGCINVANLLIARSANRRREIAMRIALGASRARLVRQLLTESLVLAAVGGIVGVSLAAAAVDLILALTPATLPGLPSVGLNLSVLAFAAGTSLLAALLCGTIPAFAMSYDRSAGALGQRAPTAAPGPARSRLQRALVTAQVALSLVLLIAAGLMLRTFANLQQVHPGFEPRGLLTFNITLPNRAVGGPGDRARLMREFHDRVAALPGVRAVGLIGGLPLSGQLWTQPFGLEGQAPEEWSENEANFRVINSDYFSAMGTRLLAGRFFSDREDVIEGRRVVIVDAKLAQRIARNGNPIGRTIGFPLDGDPIWAAVVGVVEDVRYGSLRADDRETIYVPYRQEASRTIGIAVRTNTDPDGLLAPIREQLREVNATLATPLPMYNVRAMSDYVAAATAAERFALALIAVFAMLALLLASVGLYGVVSYWVSRRTREFGVRVAVGARPAHIIGDVLRWGMRLGVFGVIVGAALSLLTSRVLDRLLFAVRPTDVVTYASVSLLLVSVVLAASYVPARRASRVDPMEVLRTE